MANANRDDNRVTALLAEIYGSSDGVTIPLTVDETNERLRVDAVISGGSSSGTEYTEGDTDAGITGVAVLGEGTANTLRPIKTDDDGHIQVDILSGAGSGGTASDDDADFTAGTTSGTPAMGVYESSPTSVTDNDLGIVGITAARRLKTSSTIDAALPAGTNNIGDVDVLSTVLPADAATETKQDTIIGHVDGIETLLGTIDADTGNLPTIETNTDFGTVTGGGTETGAVRVTIANNSTGVLSIDDNGAAITVDGSVTANAGTDLNTSALALETGGNLAGAATSLAVVDDWDESDRAKVNPIVGQAGVQGGSGTVSNTTQRVVLATDVALPTGTNAIGRTGHDITGIGHGVTTVTTAGTDVALAGSTACKRVTIQAQTDNTGVIAVGATGVDATIATGTGIILYPGDAFELEIDNLSDVFIDSSVNGEGVRYTYFT